MSRYGLIPLCYCLDTVEMISKSIDNIEKLFYIFDQPDDKDAICQNVEERTSKDVNKIKVATNLFPEEDLEVFTGTNLHYYYNYKSPKTYL